MFEIKQIVVHVGLMVQQKLLMIECVLLEMVLSRLFYLLLILQLAAMVLNVTHLVAMVVRFLHHLLGSREVVSFLVEISVIIHFATIIRCQSVLIM
jgi:hypothetical protein